MSLRILLAEDHLIVRQGVKQLLTREGYSVVAEAADGRDLFRRLAFSDELQHLAFPWRQRIISGVCVQDLRDDLGEVGADIGRSTCDFADRLEQF